MLYTVSYLLQETAFCRYKSIELRNECSPVSKLAFSAARACARAHAQSGDFSANGGSNMPPKLVEPFYPKFSRPTYIPY